MHPIYENLPQILLVLIVLLIITLFVYIKLAFPFWNRQPVYHTYDIWRWIYRNPFRIHQRFTTLMKSKYCELMDVEIVPFANATDDQKKVFANLLQCYSLNSESSLYMFHLENLDAYLSGHLYSSYMSFYKQPYYKKASTEHDTSDVIMADEPIGCISSRSGELFVNNIREPIYYIDHLIIQRNKDLRGISRKLFETHIYKTNVISKMELLLEPIMVYLFRRDRELLSGIVPLVRFTVSTYVLPNNSSFYTQTRLPEHVVLVDIHSGNMDLLLDLLNASRTLFHVFAITDINNLIGLIKSGVIYAYVLKRFDDILGLYVFRDTRIQEEESGSILELICSIQINRELFYNGFLHALGDIHKKHKAFKLLRADSVSNNSSIYWDEFYKIHDSISAYYIYNYVVPTSPVNNAFILF